MISEIWFMLVSMLIAGAICGVGLSWGYALLVPNPSGSSWMRYNLLYLLLLFGLGPLSLLVYEPIITIQALLASPNGMPAELTQKLLPMTAVYIILMALLITRLYGRGWSHFIIVLPTCAILVILLGFCVVWLNVPGGRTVAKEHE